MGIQGALSVYGMKAAVIPDKPATAGPLVVLCAGAPVSCVKHDGAGEQGRVVTIPQVKWPELGWCWRREGDASLPLSTELLALA